MSKELVSGFYEFLVKESEKKGARGEKPIFLMATLKYLIQNNLYGLSLNEMMYIQHLRLIKGQFIRLASHRMREPESSWRRLTNPNTFEMKNQVQRYISKYGDVSGAFSKLKPGEAQQLLNGFMLRLSAKKSFEVTP
ncbi:MAG: hypothetical protein ACFFEF_02975 [Candidatus Thorarchaeota archaeon]